MDVCFIDYHIIIYFSYSYECEWLYCIFQVEEARLKSRSVKASKLAAASGASSGAAWLTDSDDSSDGQLDKRGMYKL